jgi:hypothetical protein
LQYGDVPKNIAKLWQQYLQAIASYDKVIQIMHDYQLAVENKELAEKVLMNIARACYANIENMSNSPKPRLHLSNIYRHPNEQPENLYFNMQLQQDVNDYYREGRFNEGIINTPLWELNFDINNPPKEMLDSRMDVDVRASGDVFCIKLP